MNSKRTKSIIEFWNDHNTNSILSYGFDFESEHHFSFVGRDAEDNIHSVILLIPFAGIAHHIHITSIRKSKTLFKFIESTFKLIKSLPKVGIVICETQGKPQYKTAEKIAIALGFTPIDTEFGWKDYVWNTKS
jgi:hypothetical protein